MIELHYELKRLPEIKAITTNWHIEELMQVNRGNGIVAEWQPLPQHHMPDWIAYCKGATLARMIQRASATGMVDTTEYFRVAVQCETEQEAVLFKLKLA